MLHSHLMKRLSVGPSPYQPENDYNFNQKSLRTTNNFGRKGGNYVNHSSDTHKTETAYLTQQSKFVVKSNDRM